MQGVVHDDTCTLGKAGLSLGDCWERAATWSWRWVGSDDG